MSRRSGADEHRQMGLFDLVAQARAFGPALKDALTADLSASPRSREQVADAMSLLLGRPVSLFMLDAWTAQTKEGHRFPAEYLPAFAQAAEQIGAVELLAHACGGRLVVPGEVARRLAQVEAERKRLADEEKVLRALVEGVK